MLDDKGRVTSFLSHFFLSGADVRDCLEANGHYWMKDIHFGYMSILRWLEQPVDTRLVPKHPD